jgi:hypothetical protein
MFILVSNSLLLKKIFDCKIVGKYLAFLPIFNNPTEFRLKFGGHS